MHKPKGKASELILSGCKKCRRLGKRLVALEKASRPINAQLKRWSEPDQIPGGVAFALGVRWAPLKARWRRFRQAAREEHE